MLKKASTPHLVRAAIEKIWLNFDLDRNGGLVPREAKLFVKKVLEDLDPEGSYVSLKHDWFLEIDKN